MERRKWEDASEAGPATMTGRALMMEKSGTCHNDKPGHGTGNGRERSVGREFCENHARKMRTFFTRRLEPKTKSSNAFKWSLGPKRK